MVALVALLMWLQYETSFAVSSVQDGPCGDCKDHKSLNGCLEITALRARKLPDIYGARARWVGYCNDKPDAYARITYNAHTDAHPHVLVTDHVDDENNPVWNHTCAFQINTSASVHLLDVKLWDYNKNRADTLLGKGTIKLVYNVNRSYKIKFTDPIADECKGYGIPRIYLSATWHVDRIVEPFVEPVQVQSKLHIWAAAAGSAMVCLCICNAVRLKIDRGNRSSNDAVAIPEGVSMVNLVDAEHRASNDPRVSSVRRVTFKEASVQEVHPIPAGKRYHYFISHGKSHSLLNQPEALARSLHEALADKGYVGYFFADDKNEISEHDLSQTISESAAMIVCLHDETVQSECCRVEWQLALKQGLPIVCIVDQDNCLKSDVIAACTEAGVDCLLENDWIGYVDADRQQALLELTKWLDGREVFRNDEFRDHVSYMEVCSSLNQDASIKPAFEFELPRTVQLICESAENEHDTWDSESAVADVEQYIRAAFMENGLESATFGAARCLTDRRWFVRWAALIALRTVAEKGNGLLITAVVSRLEDVDIRVRQAAVDALEAVAERGDERATIPVTKLLESNLEQVRSIAAEALRRIVVKGDGKLLGRLSSRRSLGPTASRLSVVTALGILAETGDMNATACLEQAVQENDNGIVTRACKEVLSDLQQNKPRRRSITA